MSWIRTIPVEQARGRLAELYARMAEPPPRGAAPNAPNAPGRVDHILQVHSLDPAGLEAHWAVYRAAMRPSRELSLLERELIAVVVSARNGCRY